jgi:ElaB/YqjD/DUF883 family membrane-anchored ribosome-binding protein
MSTFSSPSTSSSSGAASSSRPLMSQLDGPAHDLADSAQALLAATGSAASDAVRGARQASRESLHAFSDSASHLAHDSAQAVRERAVQLRDSGTDYIRERPLQAVLIAAGAGAALALLARMLLGGHSSR